MQSASPKPRRTERSAHVQTRIPLPANAKLLRVSRVAGMTPSAYARKVLTDHLRRLKEPSS